MTANRTHRWNPPSAAGKMRSSMDDPAVRPVNPRQHLRFGWWSLLVFLTLGVVLESLHGWKVGWYLDVDNETRRLMWTLAHAHGTLLGVVHLVFAATLSSVPEWQGRSQVAASRLLTAASVLMPVGFLLGGVFTHAGDPGLGVLLVPPGALALFVAVLLTARAVQRATR